MTKRRRTIAFLLVSGGVVFLAATAAASIGAGYGRGSPLLTYALPEGARPSFDGRVVTRLEAGPYVYLEVERDGGDRAWVVTLAASAGAAPGVSRIHVVAIGHADRFASKRLSRSFDDLYFVVARPI